MHQASVGDKPCPPTTATRCDAEIKSASPTHFELLNLAKPSNFIEGNLLSSGALQFLIENLPKTQSTTGCPGYWMFQQMLDHFGASVLAIKGTWIGSKPGDSDNLDAINTFTAGNAMTLLDAAWLTWTGRQAKAWGATTVSEVSTPRGTPGKYTQIVVLFTR